MNLKNKYYWNQDEIDLLNEVYPDPDIQIHEMVKIHFKRTKSAIQIKASRLGLKRPIPKMDDIIKPLSEMINDGYFKNECLTCGEITIADSTDISEKNRLRFYFKCGKCGYKWDILEG